MICMYRPKHVITCQNMSRHVKIGVCFVYPKCGGNIFFQTSCQAENSLIKQPQMALDSSEGKRRSSAVKVPEDRDEYAEAFEQDDHTETAEPEKANVKEVETGEVEGQVPKQET